MISERRPERPRIAILISGRGSNMCAILEQASTGILKDCCEVVAVIANRERAPGLATAQDFGVRTIKVPSAGLSRTAFGQRLLEALLPLNVDYLVLAGFMRILSGEVIARYRGHIINIHPADTAAYQGADGYGWAYEQGLRETWITVHHVDEGVDTGTVLAQERVSLEGAETLADIAARGLAVEHRFYSEVLRDLFTGRAAASGDGEEQAAG